MLFSALMDNEYFKISAVDSLKIFSISCPCRLEWFDETQEWLEQYGLTWTKHRGFPEVKFNDTATLLMFKLAFAGTLRQKCRH